jgi:type I restriction-modification system DNA methylase subunit
MMSTLPQQLTLPLEKHHNHYLFSDYYLDHLLPRRLDWREATSEARAAMKRLQTIYAAFTPTENEAQTERDWIRPVLETLAHVFEVQPSIATPDGVRRPDYVFFPTDKARQAAKPLQGQEDYPATALAVGDAKHWDRSLDQTLKGDDRKPRDPFTNKNPSWQIYFYMLHTGQAWGILTNGRAWRLYHRDTAHKLNYYYEVDLPALLGNGDVEAFKYFYLFFCQASFIPNGEGRTWLDIILQESRDYAQGVSEDLKEQVYEALPHVAQGFLDYPGNGLSPDSTTLKAIYDNSLILLYRLLFILYAESRGLLPLQDNETYRLSYSLDAIKKEIERTLSKPILPTSRLYWTRLQELFGAINKGNEHLGVPAYNGDLFNPEKHPFLEQYAVGDQELRQAVDLLARTDTEEGRVFVDYRDLEVQHLGSIYEGLLEYQLRYAEEDLAVVKEKGRERYVPAGEGQEVAVPTSRVYLVTDRGERKATGSYYTPDYIVKYIVEQTLQPLLDETFARWADRKNVTEEDLVNDILSLDVLDPAMGSGHFLVEATEYIARYLVGLGLEATAGMETEAEPDYWKRRVVQSCIYGVDLNPLAVELAKLSLWLATVSKDKPLSFLDHHLRCGNSLIGARVADLGAAPVVKKRRRKAEEEEAAGQLSMFDDDTFRQSMMTAVDSMWLIEGTDSSTVKGVKEQERIYRELREELTRRYRLLADLWTARYFGVVIEPENQVVQTIENFRVQQQGLKGVAETKEVYSEQKREKPVDLLTVYRFLAGAIQNGWTDRLPQHLVQMIEDAQKIAKEKHFFHWELEFPEVFFDRFGRPLKDRAGFDAVVGNPPYFLLQGTNLQKPLSKIYPEIFSGSNDVSHFFLTRAARLLRRERALGFIVTRYWLEAHLSSELRSFLTTYVQPLRIIDFGNLQVWPDVNVLTVICIFKKPSVVATEVHVADEDRFSTALEFFNREILNLERKPVSVDPDLFGSSPWYLRAIESAAVWEKMRGQSVALDKITNNTQGIKTGNNEVFTVSLSTVQELGLEREMLIPFAQAQNVRRYKIHADEFVIYTDGSFDIDEVPAIKSYLSQFKEQLSKRAECNRGLYPWWRLQRPRDRDMLLEGERLLVPLYATENRFVFSKEVIVGMTDVYIIVTTCKRYKGAFLSAVLNSRLLNCYHSIFCKVKRAGYLEYSGNAISDLPIRRIAFTTPAKERSKLVEVGITGVTEWIEGNEGPSVGSASFIAFSGSSLGRWLDARLTADPEQSDVVHDLLAHLAEQMIEMNKEKQAEVRGFLDWLADYTGLPIDEWKLKTYVRAYWEHPWSELQRALHQNRQRMKRDVEGREAHDKIKSEFEDSLKKLQPLLARIEATDRLIDLIVYRLYGLTEEEVAVVEGE